MEGMRDKAAREAGESSLSLLSDVDDARPRESNSRRFIDGEDAELAGESSAATAR